MSNGAARSGGQSRPEGQTPYVTSAVGLEETEGRVRARRASLFTQTVVWVTILVCLAFLVGALFQTWSNARLAQDLQQALQQTQQLQRYHNSLEQQISYYQDPYVIESEARQQLGYSRSGEHVVIVIHAATQNQPSSSSQSGSPSAGFWQSWWNIFFGNG